MMLRYRMLLVMALTVAAWPAGAADILSCQSAGGFECRTGRCEGQRLYANLTVDFSRKKIKYCAGEGCYGARVAMVGAEDGGVSFAFDAKPELGRSDGRVDRLVTIHPGRKAATVGNFLADGSVAFSHMNCEKAP
ncbi:hypothetical protein [Magnetospirillum moscoviense]|uniref:Uncharacterized protein n=1 Tax=Magnetospirillum moscoviense TaxID=1437059 RepID=A0A178MLZ7_9PROT|nr:hypothetical protein [Magnetospirillum moscoviense]MBF0325805.1 hypothetical protein [Alphaproteobacteria bacterium]OAN49760.1 hypothetical protein A6A05_13090 [Magnetospirillum moscoviense]